MPPGSLMGLVSDREGRGSPATAETPACRGTAPVLPLPRVSWECLKAEHYDAK